MAKTSGKSTPAQNITRAALWTCIVIGTVAIANALIFYRTPPLASTIDEGDIRYFPTANGDVFYQRAGTGPTPLLLVHGIGAGESSFEFRRVFAALAATGTHTVYAIDLIGFGKSDKPAIDYTAQTFVDLLGDFVREVIAGADEKPRPVDVVASSLAAAYVVALADREPGRFGRLVLVGPTGMEELVAPPTMAGAWARKLLRLPVLGPALYNLVASKATIAWYLRKRIYHDPGAVSAATVDQYHTAAHQPGGDRVLASFVTGALNQDIRGAFGRLRVSVLLVWGDRARQSPLERAQAFLRVNAGTQLLTVSNAGDLPHDEQPDDFLRGAVPFLSGDGASGSAAER